MKTKRVEVFLHTDANGGSYEALFGSDMSEHGYVVIGKGFCEVDLIPHAEIVAKQIETLQGVKEKVMAEAHHKVIQIDEKIQRLLAITHQPAPEEF